MAVAPKGLELPGRARRIEFGDQRDLPLAPQEIRLRGPHNLDNAMAASAVALSNRVPAAAVAGALRGFAGVPHRLEEVGTVDGVLYVNDSKATNVSSALRGIESFDGGVHAILGGSLKGGAFQGLRTAVATGAVGRQNRNDIFLKIDRGRVGLSRDGERAHGPGNHGSRPQNNDRSSHK